MDPTVISSSYELVASTGAQEEQRATIAGMLAEQWGGSLDSKLSKLRSDPHSYILVINTFCAGGTGGPVPVPISGAAVGHARLEPASFKVCAPTDPSVGSDATVTSVIVSKAARKRGIGTVLMRMLLEKASALKYGFLYLWTKDAQSFYSKLGFLQCPKKQVSHKVAKSLDGDFLNGLGRLLNSKQQGEDVAVDPEKETWMRRRVTEFRPVVSVPADGIVREWRNCIKNATEYSSLADGRDVLRMRCLPLDVDNEQRAVLPWAGQIGPSCGVAALRIAACLLLHPSSTISINNLNSEAGEFDRDSLAGETHDLSGCTTEQTSLSRFSAFPGLLQTLLDSERSVDGELYDIDDLSWLINHFFASDGITASVRQFGSSGASGVDFNKLHSMYAPKATVVHCGSARKTSTDEIVLLPYDRDSSGDVPGSFSGMKAHYAVVVGVSSREKDDRRRNDAEEDLSGKFDNNGVAASHNNHMLLVCLQGLSKRPVIDYYSNWLVSNEQLNRRSDMTSCDATKRGSIKLKGKCIVMTRSVS